MTFVKDLTGPPTLAFGVAGTDLGIARQDPTRDGKLALMFGDTFSEPGLRGEWNSPVVLMYNQQLEPLGPPIVDHEGKPMIDSQGRVQQLWPYTHANPVFSTVLPTDFIRLGNYWWVHVMVTQGLGNEVWTEWQRSPDLVNWEWVEKTQPPLPDMTMLTFDEVDGFVYIYGTGGLKRDKPIKLWRCPSAMFPHLATWEAWDGSGWNKDPSKAAVLMTGQYGELCFRHTSWGNVLSYFDAGNYEVAARATTATPEWIGRAGRLTRIASGLDYPQLYGGFLVPGTGPKDAQFVVSQWRTSDNSVYKAGLHKQPLKVGGRNGIWPWAVLS